MSHFYYVFIMAAKNNGNIIVLIWWLHLMNIDKANLMNKQKIHKALYLSWIAYIILSCSQYITSSISIFNFLASLLFSICVYCDVSFCTLTRSFVDDDCLSVHSIWPLPVVWWEVPCPTSELRVLWLLRFPSCLHVRHVSVSTIILRVFFILKQ